MAAYGTSATFRDRQRMTAFAPEAEAHGAAISLTAYRTAGQREASHKRPFVRQDKVDLRRHLLNETSLSPLQVQKQIRLQEPFQLLSSSEDVAAVGFAVGVIAPRNSAASIGGRLARRPARTRNVCAGRTN